MDSQNGSSLYEYAASRPTRREDPSGLTVKADVEVKLDGIYSFDAELEGDEYCCCEFFPNPIGHAAGHGSVFHYTAAAGSERQVQYPGQTRRCKNCAGENQPVECWQYDFQFSVTEAFYTSFTIFGFTKGGVGGGIDVSATFQTARHDFLGSLVICANGYEYAVLKGLNYESYKEHNYIDYKFPFTGKAGQWDFNTHNDKDGGSPQWNSFKDESQTTKECNKGCKDVGQK
jgi:hypothetical protein